jgi:hypothetical protein
LQRDVDVSSRRLPGRPEPEQNSGEGGEEKSKTQDAPVEADSFEAWGVRRSECDQGVAPPGREDQSERAADYRNDKAFQQKLPDD